MHTLMIAVSAVLALGLSGTGIIAICRRLDRVGVRLAAVERNQSRHMQISARGVAVVERIDQPSGPQRIHAHR